MGPPLNIVTTYVPPVETIGIDHVAQDAVQDLDSVPNATMVAFLELTAAIEGYTALRSPRVERFLQLPRELRNMIYLVYFDIESGEWKHHPKRGTYWLRK